MNTSQEQFHTCKSSNIKQVWKTKTLQYHITATPQYYYKKLQLHKYYFQWQLHSIELKLHYYKKAIHSCFY